MGKAPLPADLRTLCQCSAGCIKTWEPPELRYWAHWPASDDFGLNAAVFIESDGLIDAQQCQYFGTPDIPTVFTDTQMVRAVSAPVSSAFSDWAVRCFTIGVLQTVNDKGFGPNENCTVPKVLPLQLNLSPKMVGVCRLLPIRWYEDADDVRPP